MPGREKAGWKIALTPPFVSQNCRTWHRSPSRLLDELEVPEELIVLLDPEPGPGGGVACGTTRHLAARYAECLLPGPPSPTHCSPVTHHCGP